MHELQSRSTESLFENHERFFFRTMKKKDVWIETGKDVVPLRCRTHEMWFYSLASELWSIHFLFLPYIFFWVTWTWFATSATIKQQRVIMRYTMMDQKMPYCYYNNLLRLRKSKIELIVNCKNNFASVFFMHFGYFYSINNWL